MNNYPDFEEICKPSIGLLGGLQAIFEQIYLKKELDTDDYEQREEIFDQ